MVIWRLATGTSRKTEARCGSGGRRSIDAGSANEIIFTRGTTSAINTVAYGWGLYNLKPGDKILLTKMEHHANVVPWQLITRHTGAELEYLPLTDDYLVDISNLDAVIDERVRVVAFSGMSNVLGTIGPHAELIEAARSVGAITIIDGAQLIPHAPTSVRDLGADIDFLPPRKKPKHN